MGCKAKGTNKLTLRQRIAQIEQSIPQHLLKIIRKESSYEYLTKRAIEAITSNDINLAIMLLMVVLENRDERICD